MAAPMTEAVAKKLRAPFKPEQIGKLPKPTKKENPKGRCQECGGYHGLPAVHLDYVGHAAVTDRLLEVDPAWTWEPMAYGPSGEPLMVNGGLWIRLTVCGVTRPGFGDATTGGAIKEIIGDAIRNAAMRFGVALDLWSKEDLTGSDESPQGNGEPKADAAGEASNPAAAASANGTKKISKDQAGRLYTIAGTHKELAKRIVFEMTGAETSLDIPVNRYDEVVAAIQKAVGAVEEAPFA